MWYRKLQTIYSQKAIGIRESRLWCFYDVALKISFQGKDFFWKQQKINIPALFLPLMPFWCELQETTSFLPLISDVRMMATAWVNWSRLHQPCCLWAVYRASHCLPSYTFLCAFHLLMHASKGSGCLDNHGRFHQTIISVKRMPGQYGPVVKFAQ